MPRFRASILWPAIPAVAVIVLLASSPDTPVRCPPYTTSLPPHPELCLPTLVPSLTGADPVAVAVSWLITGTLVYLVVLTATFTMHRRHSQPTP